MQSLTRETHNGKSIWVMSDPKNPASRRTIALPAPAVKLLRARWTTAASDRLSAGKAWRDNGLVFCDVFGGPHNLDALTGRATRLRRRISLPGGLQIVHGLRHLFGTTLNAAGIDVKTIQTAMGRNHAATTLDLYIKPNAAEAIRAADKMGDLFG